MERTSGIEVRQVVVTSSVRLGGASSSIVGNWGYLLDSGKHYLLLFSTPSSGIECGGNWMALMRNAFAVGCGMLTDMTETPAEQQPTSHLFADETGCYKIRSATEPLRSMIRQKQQKS